MYGENYSNIFSHNVVSITQITVFQDAGGCTTVKSSMSQEKSVGRMLLWNKLSDFPFSPQQ